MTIWWEALSPYQQAMFGIACAATLVMIVFMAMMLFGGDADDSFEGDVDDLDNPELDSVNDTPISGIAGLRILTVRGVLAFFSIGGWTAYGLADSLTPLWSSLIGAAAGAVAAFLLALAIRASMKLESQGNLDYRNAIGKTGSIYIKVPKQRTGVGKVSVTFQERYLEVDAMTDEEDDLTTGTAVEIVGLERETVVLVRKSSNVSKK